MMELHVYLSSSIDRKLFPHNSASHFINRISEDITRIRTHMLVGVVGYYSTLESHCERLELGGISKVTENSLNSNLILMLPTAGSNAIIDVKHINYVEFQPRNLSYWEINLSDFRGKLRRKQNIPDNSQTYVHLKIIPRMMNEISRRHIYFKMSHNTKVVQLPEPLHLTSRHKIGLISITHGQIMNCHPPHNTVFFRQVIPQNTGDPNHYTEFENIEDSYPNHYTMKSGSYNVETLLYLLNKFTVHYGVRFIVSPDTTLVSPILINEGKNSNAYNSFSGVLSFHKTLAEIIGLNISNFKPSPEKNNFIDIIFYNHHKLEMLTPQPYKQIPNALSLKCNLVSPVSYIAYNQSNILRGFYEPHEYQKKIIRHVFENVQYKQAQIGFFNSLELNLVEMNTDLEVYLNPISPMDSKKYISYGCISILELKNNPS